MTFITNSEVMGYMVWVVEIAAKKFFNGDKGMSYSALRECGIWDFYVANYDVTHTLGAEVIIDERTGLFTCAPIEIIDLFAEEYA